MDVYDKILDYIKEQADRYDSKNMQFEQDILFSIRKGTNKLLVELPKCVLIDVDSQIKMAQLMIRLTDVFAKYTSTIINYMSNKFSDYSDTAYKYTGDLIDLGNEISKNPLRIKEMTSIDYSDDAIDFIKKHAFELMKGYKSNKLDKIRNKLVNMMLTGHASKSEVRSMIEDEIGVNRSKAEEIAQTELSRAYNFGTMKRLTEYEHATGEKVYKYWHGFKYSDVTCNYCRERIGGIYDLNDTEESLPAHVRCRCVWLPILESWRGQSVRKLITKANMLNTGYSKELIYQRINNRLGIDYAEYLSDTDADDYINGDRSPKVIKALQDARNSAINDKITTFGIDKDTSNSKMSAEFNTQLDFWKKYIAKSMVDNDKDALLNSADAIKGVMLLNWNTEQMEKWNKLISLIK